MRVLSGTVTSSTKTALSRQEGVGLGVKGSEVGEAVGGISVGRVKPGLVGGRVDVTKTTGASVGVPPETCTQEVKSKTRDRASVNFFIMKICLMELQNLRYFTTDEDVEFMIKTCKCLSRICLLNLSKV